MANILRNKIGSVLSVTTANAIASAAYAVAADKLAIDNSTNKALLADFELEVTFGTAPVAGAVQLVAIDYSLDGNTAGPAAAATMIGRTYTMSPMPAASNAVTAMRLSCNSVPLANKTDFYLFNNSTGQSIPVGSVLRAQCWSPG